MAMQTNKHVHSHWGMRNICNYNIARWQQMYCETPSGHSPHQSCEHHWNSGHWPVGGWRPQSPGLMVALLCYAICFTSRCYITVLMLEAEILLENLCFSFVFFLGRGHITVHITSLQARRFYVSVIRVVALFPTWSCLDIQSLTDTCAWKNNTCKSMTVWKAATSIDME